MKCAARIHGLMIVAGAGMALGCGSGGDQGSGGGDLLAGGQQGIYMVQSDTFNELGCDTEGPPVDGAPKYLYLSNDPRGRANIIVGFCSDIAGCQSDYQRAITFTGGQNGYLIPRDSASGGFLEDFYNPGSASGAACTGAGLTHTGLAVEGSNVTVEARYTPIEQLSVDAQGSCTADAARSAAQSATCGTYHVYRATYLQPL